MPRRMLINAFSMNCVSHIQHGLWVRNDTRQLEYTQLDPWVELAQILEKAFMSIRLGIVSRHRSNDQ